MEENEFSNNSVETPIPRMLSDFHFTIIRSRLKPKSKEFYPSNVLHIENMKAIAKTSSYTFNINNAKDISPRIFENIDNENNIKKQNEIFNSDSCFKYFI